MCVRDIGRGGAQTSDRRRVFRRSSRVPVPALHLICFVPFAAITSVENAPYSGTAPRAHLTSARWNCDLRPHGGNTTSVHLRMCAVKVSAGLRRRHVNHGGASTTAVGRRPLATPDLLLKHLDKHLQHKSKIDETLETCVCSYCNMCNTKINF
jgi:hypothetical protein